MCRIAFGKLRLNRNVPISAERPLWNRPNWSSKQLKMLTGQHFVFKYMYIEMNCFDKKAKIIWLAFI